MDFFTSLLVSIIVFIPIFYFYQKSSDDKKATHTNLLFDSTTKELTLNKRDSTNRKVLSVTELWNHTLNYEPEKYVYTGATVGGVHTGGVHKEGGYNYVTGTKTGKYHIWYSDGVRYETNDNSGFVHSIKLADMNLVKKAKESKCVSKYLQENMLVLEYKTLSKQECTAIISWLCGEE